MNRKHAFILALLFTLVISNCLYLFSKLDDSGKERVLVSRVIDGDTFETSDGRTVRLANINAPEKNVNSSYLSKEYLSKFTNKELLLDKITIEKYGRTLGRVYTTEGDYINLELVKKGFSSKFLVEESELSDFNKAEEKAVNEQMGIWSKSDYSDCIHLEIEEKKEELVIINSCNPINLNGWIIKDESRKQYKFNGFIYKELTLHSSIGIDNSKDLFWNSEQHIWNDDRDTAYLYDEEGKIVFHKSYGY